MGRRDHIFLVFGHRRASITGNFGGRVAGELLRGSHARLYLAGVGTGP